MSLRSVVALCVLVPSLSFAWGFNGHRRLSSLMQDAMPQGHCLRAWYSARQSTTLQDRSTAPDTWRNSDPDEWPRHFIDLDVVMPVSNYPRDFDAAIRFFGDRAARSNGTVPWRVEERYAMLVAAFRANDANAILDQSFVLSHYVFDAFSVLHNTQNSDPNGLHARWESDMMTTTNMNGLTTLAQTYYGTAGRADPRYNIFDIAIAGNAQVAALLQDDMMSTTTAQLYTNSRDLTARRWADGVTLMSSILWTAWAEAGSPELTGFSNACSRTVPVAEIVIRGFPPVGGFTHPPPVPDAGVVDSGVPVVDAGMNDAGVDAGMGAGGGGGSSAGGGNGNFGGGLIFGGGLGGGSMEPVGCSCASDPFAAVLMLAAFIARRRRTN
jgi:hypothetical protein